MVTAARFFESPSSARSTHSHVDVGLTTLEPAGGKPLSLRFCPANEMSQPPQVTCQESVEGVPAATLAGDAVNAWMTGFRGSSPLLLGGGREWSSASRSGPTAYST